ncbi:MAG: hypothetical protein IJ001_10635 [Oscillospiraceae bacterium]|nr:hypothetical protein [Oscillospiraceae bacterium]
MKLERTVLGYPIWAEINRLDSGWDIGIYGGCCTHVGAVSMAEPSGDVETIERLHHKDSFVSVRWAEEMSRLTQEPVCVRCGIHYDSATKEQLSAIIAECDEMLQELVAVLRI